MPLDLFSKSKIPDELPPGLWEIIENLKNSPGQEECLKKAYAILSQKYHGERLKTYIKLPEVFIEDIGKLWGKSGYLHCTNINFILRTILVKSGFFKEEGIRIRWTLIWYLSPHQYLTVKIGNKEVPVDIWAGFCGIGFGDYAHGFHC